ncbi:MAG: BPSS1780 family membrane protein [Rhodocyclaceae bacterium]|nr:BPSS1780 family membrane protein [Rhodocyclaceae bacterium]
MQARRLPAARGTYWLLEGFRLFRRNPPLITALTLLYLLLVQGVAVLLPGIGPILLPLALPALTLIVANGCRLVDEGLAPGKATLLRGLIGKEGNGLAMLRLGLLQLIGALILVWLNSVLGNGVDPFSSLEHAASLPPEVAGVAGTAAVGAGAAATATKDADVLGALLRLMLLATPLIIAFWFAPFLTGWDRVSPLKSMFFSIVASWRNWRAFVMFTFAAVVVAGVVPGLLLILVSQIAGAATSVAFIAMRMLLVFLVAPVLTASIYISYRDIFHPRPGEINESA